MSLVNDMLNDLEERRAQQDTKAVDLGWLTAQGKTEKRSTNYWMPVAVLLTIVLAAIVWRMYQPVSFSAQPNSSNVATNITDSRQVEQPQGAAVPIQQPETTAVANTDISVNADAVVNDAVAVDTVDKSTVVTEAVVEQPATSSERPQASTDTVAMIVGPRTVEPAETNAVPAAAKKTTAPVKRPLSLTPEVKDKNTAKKAGELIRRGSYQAAEKQLSTALAENPAAIHSGQLLVSLLTEQQRFAAAQQALDDLRAIYPDHIALYGMQGRLYLLAGSPERTVQLLLTAQPPLTEYSDYYELLALAAQRSGEYVLSEQVYRSLIDFDRDRSAWWAGLAIALDLQGKAQLARNTYIRALRLTGLEQSLRDYARQRVDALAGL